jgi:hypothetical protein
MLSGVRLSTECNDIILLFDSELLFRRRQEIDHHELRTLFTIAPIYIAAGIFGCANAKHVAINSTRILLLYFMRRC